MPSPADLILIGVLCIIAWQDFKTRALWWPWLVVLAGASVFWRYSATGWENIISDSLTNLGFILVQLLGLTLYFSFKQKKIVLIADKYLGWGDIAFLGAICFLFEPLRFILFYLGSIVLLTAGYAVYLLALKQKSETIPLAGGMAVLLAMFIAVEKSF